MRPVGEGHDPPGSTHRLEPRTYANPIHFAFYWFCSNPSDFGRVMTLPYGRFHKSQLKKGMLAF